MIDDWHTTRCLQQLSIFQSKNAFSVLIGIRGFRVGGSWPSGRDMHFSYCVPYVVARGLGIHSAVPAGRTVISSRTPFLKALTFVSFF